MMIFNKLIEMDKRKDYASGFKTKIFFEALEERETIQESAKKYDQHPTQISTWESLFLSNASTVFEEGANRSDDEKEKIEFFKIVWQLQIEVDFLKKYWRNRQTTQVNFQKCATVAFTIVSRHAASDNQELMKLIDKQYIETAFYGVIQMTRYLRELGHGRRAYHISVFVAQYGNNLSEPGLVNGYTTYVTVAMATIPFRHH